MKFQDPDKPEWAIPDGARLYAEWLATPPMDREVLTKNAWCDDNDVGRSTLSKWEKSIWWTSLMEETCGNPYGFSNSHDMAVMEAIFEKASRGDMPAAKMYLDQRKIGAASLVSKDDVQDLTDEELEAQAERVLARKLDRRLHAV